MLWRVTEVPLIQRIERGRGGRGAEVVPWFTCSLGTVPGGSQNRTTNRTSYSPCAVGASAIWQLNRTTAEPAYRTSAEPLDAGARKGRGRGGRGAEKDQDRAVCNPV